MVPVAVLTLPVPLPAPPALCVLLPELPGDTLNPEPQRNGRIVDKLPWSPLSLLSSTDQTALVLRPLWALGPGPTQVLHSVRLTSKIARCTQHTPGL
jgi:hypothetical protein